MNLSKKRILAAKTLGVGKDRIIFNVERLDEIKEAITKQDIRDLFAGKAIAVRSIIGRKKVVKRKTRRRAGSIKSRSRNTKREYMNLIRKLRAYLSELRRRNQISKENYQKLRKEARAHMFKNKAHLKERITQLQ